MLRWLKCARNRRWFVALALIAGLLAVCGCRTLKFYGQAIAGQYEIFSKRQLVTEVLTNPTTSAELRLQLELLQRLLAFAETELNLPAENQYGTYVDLQRKFVVWNVQAAPQFSLEPKTWWYPFVGRLEYRGYFRKQGAEDLAEQLREDGYDVFVGGVEAYSTLGFFRDPVLNTFIHREESELAEVIFHELAHQRLFARGDTDFNEAFATVVGEEGARRWLQSQGKTNLLADYEIALQRNGQFVRLIMSTRAELEKVYGDTRDEDGKVKAAKQLPAPTEELLARKRQMFENLQARYRALRAEWDGFSGYDAWFARELNNAQLNTIANYYDYVPGFVALLKLKEGNLEQFYNAAEELSRKPRDERHEWLRTLAAAATNNTAAAESLNVER